MELKKFEQTYEDDSAYITLMSKKLHIYIDKENERILRKWQREDIKNYFSNVQYILDFIRNSDKDIELSDSIIVNLAYNGKDYIKNYILELIERGHFNRNGSSSKCRYTDEFYTEPELIEMYGEIPSSVKPYPDYNGPTGPSEEDNFGRGRRR